MDYNLVKLGFKIDIVGEVLRVVRVCGMKFLVFYYFIKSDDWINYVKEGVDKYFFDIFWVDVSFGGIKGVYY